MRSLPSLCQFHKLAIILIGFGMIAGCASAPPTEPPAPWMMAKPKPISDIKAGDDIIEKYAELRRDAGKDKSQIRGLQSYVKAIVKAK